MLPSRVLQHSSRRESPVTLSGASESVRVGRNGIHCCRGPRTEVSLCQGPPSGQGRQWKRNFVTPVSELPARTPVPTHRYEPREVRRQGKPRRSRSPSRRVVVKLGSRSACADGAPTAVGAPSFIPGRQHHPLAGRTPRQRPSRTRPRSPALARIARARPHRPRSPALARARPHRLRCPVDRPSAGHR